MAFPSNPQENQVFIENDEENFDAGMYVYSNGNWVRLSNTEVPPGKFGYVAFNRNGDAMFGPLVLAKQPQVPMEAATKSFVEDLVATISGSFEPVGDETEKGSLVVGNGTGISSLNVGSDGYILTADAAEPLGVKWMPLPGAATLNLNDLGDVVISSPANNQVLKYNGSQWVNAAAAANGLDDLTDVVISTPAINQVLKYNGTQWINTVLGALNELSDVTITTPSAGHILQYNGVEWINVPNPAADSSAPFFSMF